MYQAYLKSIRQHSFLVTGGAGFIGSNLVKVLLDNHAKHVRVLDNLSNGFKKNIAAFLSYPNFEFIEGDIRNLDTCIQACNGIEFVSHQAALGSVPRSIKDPITTNEVNIGGHLNMLMAVKETGVQRMVYAASSSTYGDSKTLPKEENVIGKPLSPYAVTKYVNELYADVFAKTYGIETIGLRYFNVFGPKQDPNGAYAAVIPLFIDALMMNKPPTMNGDGMQSRDFTFVDNAVQANILAMLNTNKNCANQVYNIAFGESITLNQLYQYLQQIVQVVLPATYGPERKGDIKDSLANISKAKELLGYEPQYSVKTGLAITFEWFKENYAFIKS